MRYYDSYDYVYSSPIEDTLIWILMIYVIVLLVVGVFALVSYVFKGIGMYTIAKRQGRENAWLAFIPFARTYLHGELGGSIKLKNKSIRNPGIWLLALPFIYGAVFGVFYAILWVIGFSAILTMSNGYYGSSIGGGTIMGCLILLLILVVVSVLYEAIYKVLGILVNHQIYERFTSKNMSIAHAVLSAVVPLYESICLFVMRNRPYNPGMEPEIRNPYMQTPPDYSWRPVEEPQQSAAASVPPVYPPVEPMPAAEPEQPAAEVSAAPSVTETVQPEAGAEPTEDAAEKE